MDFKVQGYCFGTGTPILSAILTKSAKDFAPIFRMSWLRWTLTVASLVPIASAICLFRRPETTHGSDLALP